MCKHIFDLRIKESFRSPLSFSFLIEFGEEFTNDKGLFLDDPVYVDGYREDGIVRLEVDTLMSSSCVIVLMVG